MEKGCKYLNAPNSLLCSKKVCGDRDTTRGGERRTHRAPPLSIFSFLYLDDKILLKNEKYEIPLSSIGLEFDSK